MTNLLSNLRAQQSTEAKVLLLQYLQLHTPPDFRLR